MTDLILQDFKDITGEGLGHILSDEKSKMFGETEVQSAKKKAHRSVSGSFASLFAKLKKRGGKNVRT